MGFGWKDIVPGDPYVVRLARPISPLDLTYITQLYQPLVGPLSVSLYITLYHEQSLDENAYGNHRSLMSMMTTSLDQLVKAREVLEAIGLLRTATITSEQGDRLYDYLLQAPLSPASFFSDDMLSIILLNRVGKSRYRFLREKFVGYRTELEEKGVRQEITRSFDEIFHSISPTELVVTSGSETEIFLSEMESTYPTKATDRSVHPKIHFKQVEPDFVFLEAALPKTLGVNRKLPPTIRELLKELSFFYQLDDMQLSYFLQEPYVYNDNNELDADRLKAFIKDWYLRNNKGQQPTVEVAAATTTKPVSSGTVKTEQSLEKEHREALSRLSPIVLLEQHQGGGKASPADLKILEELVQQYMLEPAVINVLLEYVMITNNKQLPRSLILKIASHWKRLKIRTVDEALEQAKQLYNEMKSKTKSGESIPKTTKTRKSNVKKDELPEWVVRQLSDKNNSVNAQPQDVDEAKKKEVDELLRALGEID
jgi:replication initiation and membrane attachment protein